ncbi:hypothetical protein GRI40_00410 [Altererythrobacter aerius]|uniref:Uncharacterized protein n=1 Tax=Tsuneonella aeria TaxID=1837929 RepID=A0A6I4TAJ1_9SPHN|nr:hypothetical protein [Tsuneonella aeria]
MDVVRSIDSVMDSMSAKAAGRCCGNACKHCRFP